MKMNTLLYSRPDERISQGERIALTEINSPRRRYNAPEREAITETVRELVGNKHTFSDMDMLLNL